MDWQTLEEEQERAAEKARLDVLRQKSTDELGRALAELDKRGELDAADKIASILAERAARKGNTIEARLVKRGDRLLTPVALGARSATYPREVVEVLTSDALTRIRCVDHTVVIAPADAPVEIADPVSPNDCADA